MGIPVWIRDTMRGRPVPYHIRRHEPAFTAQDLAQKEHVSGYNVLKTVAVIADDRSVLLVLPACCNVDMNRVRDMLGAGTARLATELELSDTFYGCELGAIPPLRHWPGVDVIVDHSLLDIGECIFPAGTHEDAIVMNMADWLNLADARVGDFARPIAGGWVSPPGWRSEWEY